MAAQCGGPSVVRRHRLVRYAVHSRSCSPSRARSSPSHPPWQAEGRHAQPPTDQILVRLAADASLDASALDATAGVKLKQVRRLSDGSYVFKLPKRLGADEVRTITDRLAARGDVLSAEPDALMQPLSVPTDPSWSQEWDMFAPSSGNYGIDLPGARDITLGSSSLTIGVIDTGYRPHVDLTGRFVGGYDFIVDTLVANDGNGRDSDALDPGDWITSAENASGYFVGCGVSNSSWHGTHVSGTIGAVSDNGIGVAGINQNSKIQPLRVLGKCGGYTSDIADAIRWSAGLPVSGIPNNNPTPDRVVNISLGGSGAVRLGHAGRDQRSSRSGHCRGRRSGQRHLGRVELHPGQLRQRNHGRRNRAYGESRVLLELRHLGRDRGARRRRPAREDDPLDAERRHPRAGRRLVRELPGNEHGDTARRRHRLADVVGESIADAGAGDDDVAGDRNAVPGRKLVHDIVVRSGHCQRCRGSCCGQRRRRWAGQARSVREDLACEHGVHRRHVRQPAVGCELRRNELFVLRRHVNDNQCAGNAWVNVAGATSATVTGLAQGTNYYWQVKATNTAGDTEADTGVWRTFATQPGPTPPAAFSKSSPGNGAAEPALACHAQVGCERGRNRVPVVYLDRQRDVHVQHRPATRR